LERSFVDGIREAVADKSFWSRTHALIAVTAAEFLHEAQKLLRLRLAGSSSRYHPGCRPRRFFAGVINGATISPISLGDHFPSPHLT